MSTPLKQHDGACWLTKQIIDKSIFCVGKLGTSELEAILFYIRGRTGLGKRPYLPHIRKNMFINAGLFPDNDETIDEWVQHIIHEVLEKCTGLVQWNVAYKFDEILLLDHYSPKSERLVLRSLEPYYESTADTSWVYNIPSSYKVAVISPFADSIQNQIPKLAEIWPNKPVWNPELPTILPIQCGYAPVTTIKNCPWPSHVKTWKSAVAYIVERTMESNPNIAIIGCGALSLPIAAALKKKGVAAIHLGGATQILFGIKGRRWNTHDVISRFYNPAWIAPSAYEVPDNYHWIENGCYW